MIDGFEVVEHVPSRGGGKYRCAEVLDEFMGCDAECIGKDYGDCDSARLATLSFRQHIASRGIGVKVVKRGTKMLLVKE